MTGSLVRGIGGLMIVVEVGNGGCGICGSIGRCDDGMKGPSKKAPTAITGLGRKISQRLVRGLGVLETIDTPGISKSATGYGDFLGALFWDVRRCMQSHGVRTPRSFVSVMR